MTKPIVLAIASRTTIATDPWLATHQPVLIDPALPKPHNEHRIPKTLLEALPHIPRPSVILGFPPCTDLAASGSAHWQKKHKANPYFQAQAAALPMQILTLATYLGVPYMIENPRGAMTALLGPANYIIHPWHYSGYADEDHFTKETHIWCGNGFVMPDPKPRNWEPPEKSRILLSNKAEREQSLRGFSTAVYLANRSHR